ncbi:MAG: hypothetical protein WAW12_04365, partial [Pseudomonas sp.]
AARPCKVAGSVVSGGRLMVYPFGESARTSGGKQVARARNYLTLFCSFTTKECAKRAEMTVAM